jgi:hypothetical protein
VTDQQTPQDQQPLQPMPDATPDDGIAGIEWLIALTDRHVMPVTSADEVPVMAAAWALGFAGATRVQVWWVLRDERLRRAYASIVRALGRVAATPPPSWTDAVTDLSTAERAALVDVISGLDEPIVRVEAGPLHAMCAGHPDATIGAEGEVSVPVGALDQLAAAARSVTPADIALLLQRARGPFETRLDQALRVSGDDTTAFMARRRGRRVA